MYLKILKNINNNILILKKRIFLSCKKFNKQEKKISIIVVSKSQSTDNIQKIINLGFFNFGENYLQEGLKKIYFFKKNKNINWHFIGKIQSNKIKSIAENFHWCQSIDNINKAKKLNKFRPKYLNKLNVLIQVNIDKEKNKSGISVDKIFEFTSEISNLSKLNFRGLMFIPKIENNSIKQINNYSKIYSILKKLKSIYKEFNILSCGMSNDLESAIAAGSNMLRIGTAIFGKRKK